MTAWKLRNVLAFLSWLCETPAYSSQALKMIEFTCTCGKQYNLADELSGKKVRCAACQKVVEVPVFTNSQVASKKPTKQKKKKPNLANDDDFVTGDELVDRIASHQSESIFGQHFDFDFRFLRMGRLGFSIALFLSYSIIIVAAGHGGGPIGLILAVSIAPIVFSAWWPEMIGAWIAVVCLVWSLFVSGKLSYLLLFVVALLGLVSSVLVFVLHELIFHERLGVLHTTIFPFACMVVLSLVRVLLLIRY